MGWRLEHENQWTKEGVLQSVEEFVSDYEVYLIVLSSSIVWRS